jgi:predicted nuclease of predicted toxin-antitoxin system
MRLLADRCIARSTISGLRDDGHDVLALAETELNPPDEEILSLATTESRVLITEDADFGTHIFREGAASPGVIRIEQRSPIEQLQTTRRILLLHDGALSRGAIVTARRRRIRVTERP